MYLDQKWKQKDSSKEKPIWSLHKPVLSTHHSPLTMFEKFFTLDLMDHICHESILYARSKGKSFEMDHVKLKKFISILLISGYVIMPRKEMYWQQAEDTHISAVSAMMSRNEFDTCMQNLHLANNGNLSNEDKFGKVRPLLNHLNQACLENFFPEQLICVYESMIPYYGKHSTKQFMKNKPTKFSYKVWCSATRLGYIIQFEPYQGAGTFMNDKNLGMGGTVVKELIMDLPRPVNCTYHILFDNLFTSMNLLAYLKSVGHVATGTLRANRTAKAPLTKPNVVEKKERGWNEVVTDVNNDITIVRWFDNRCVTVASTFGDLKPLQEAKRYIRQERQKKTVVMPNIVKEYNYAMGGVDQFDQNLACYSTNLRSKWWWPLFRYALDLCKFV